MYQGFIDERLAVFIIVFFAIFTQSLTGFGLALISMPLLTVVLGIQTTAPLVAFFGLIAEVVLLLYYRHHLDLGVVWRLVVASILGVPLGVWALRQVNEEVVLLLLGLVVGGYALYALLNLRLPALNHPLWVYGFGFVAGILGGAYNTAGPPVIIYGNCRQWSPAQFKGNLQAFFLVTGITVFISHVLAGNYTPLVWRNSLVAIPAMALGLLLGLNLDKRISASTFRRIVLWFLLALGFWLIFG